MKNKVIFLYFGIAAIITTSIGYLVDSDPPYADFKLTVIEFSIMTAIFFILFSVVYLGYKLVSKFIKS